MPSTTSSSVLRLLASSTVMTPSLPTLRMASARKRPISVSPLAEMVPIWAISSFEVIFLDEALTAATTASTARSMPRFRSIGFMPAATDLTPSRTIAWARTVAVVVPSPARSLVLEATSRTICAPMFSNLSSSSMSLATVTPSLVMRGAPKDFSITTLRPLGPSVTFTAFASVSTPRSIRSRASVENFTSLAAIFLLLSLNDCQLAICSGGLPGRAGLVDHAEKIALLHNQVVLAVDLHLRAGPLAEQHAVSRLDVDRDQLALLIPAARTRGDDLALLRFFLRGVWNDDAAGGLLLGIDTAHEHAVVQWTVMHAHPPYQVSDIKIRVREPAPGRKTN